MLFIYKEKVLYTYLNRNYIRPIQFDTLTCRNIISPITPGGSILIPRQLIFKGKYPNQMKLGIFPNQQYEEFIVENKTKKVLGYISGIDLKKAIEFRAQNNIKNYNKQIETLEVISYKEVINDEKQKPKSDEIDFSGDGVVWD